MMTASEIDRRISGPNNRARIHITAAKPPLTALGNSQALAAALGKQESVRRVVVCKSVARTRSVSPTLDRHNRRAEPELCSRSHKARSRHLGTTPGPMLHPPKAPK
jgi:hypothetical protein